jgi:hypothetical protein
MPVVAAPESHIVDPREFENEESYFHVMKGSRSYKTVAC